MKQHLMKSDIVVCVVLAQSISLVISILKCPFTCSPLCLLRPRRPLKACTTLAAYRLWKEAVK